MTKWVAAVFGALVVATFGAFFVAARLKHTPSFVQRIQIETYGTGVPIFSPNGDGRRDRVRFSMLFKKAGRVTLSIVNADGDPVRTLLDDHQVRDYQGLGHIIWDGRDDHGRLVPDGRYKLRIALRDQGRTIVYPTSILKDTTPPHPRVTSIGPQKAYGPELLPEAGGGPAEIHFGPALIRPQLQIFRTGPGRVREVRTVKLSPGDRIYRWDGTNDAGRPVSPGVYLAVPEWRDPAGNIGTSVPLGRDGLPVITRGRLPGHGGMMVRYVAAKPPTTPAKARDRLQVFLDARGQRYNWDIRKLGEPRPRKRSSQSKTRPVVTFKAPGGASGVYLFEVRTRHHATRVPIAVQARQPVAGTAAKPRGVLVLLPFITWQGQNPVDDDGDGAPNTLVLGTPVKPYRFMAGTGLPQGFTEVEAPMLQWLGHNGKRYDINTDMGLLVGRGPQLAGHHGVLIAGDARWLPGAVRAKLRAFARAGGSVVSIGTDSLRRTVKLDHKQRLADPSPDGPIDVFGERIGPLTTKSSTLTVFQDDPGVNLFKGGEGVFNDIPAWEETVKLGNEAELQSTAVTAPPAARRVIVAARFGKGLVIRPGFPAFAPRLVGQNPDPAISALMARMWTLLSR